MQRDGRFKWFYSRQHTKCDVAEVFDELCRTIDRNSVEISKELTINRNGRLKQFCNKIEMTFSSYFIYTVLRYNLWNVFVLYTFFKLSAAWYWLILVFK